MVHVCLNWFINFEFHLLFVFVLNSGVSALLLRFDEQQEWGSYAFTTNSNNVLHLGFYFVLTLIYGGDGLAPAEGTRPRQ